MKPEPQESWLSVILPQAKELVQLLEAGEEAKAQRVLEQMRNEREQNLFAEIGKLTRQLHEAMINFNMDARLTDLAANDIPDARERLNYVIKMTEQAANRTMDGLENCMPTVTQLSRQAHDLKLEVGRLTRKEMSAAEFRGLLHDLNAYMETTETQLHAVQANLNDVILAQDYQDLTGQVIRKVINLVQEVEQSLVEMIRMFGALPEYSAAKEKGVELTKGAEGPIMHAEERADVVHGQDDVDDLLSSLGF